MTRAEVGFAPRDLTDGRSPGSWKTRYSEPGAKHRIGIEAAYLTLLFISVPVAILVVWLEWPVVWLRVPAPKARAFSSYSIAWLSGTFGGVLLGMKWLYHSVGKGFWNQDRLLWRLFTPHISGGLAFIFIAASQSMKMFSPGLTATRLTSIVALSALVGLFSDNALAKLAEVAETLFGPVKVHLPHRFAGTDTSDRGTPPPDPPASL